MEEIKTNLVEPQPMQLTHAPRLATVKAVASNEPYKTLFTECSLRHLIYEAEDRYSASGEKVPGNGLAMAIIRLGGRVLIDLNAFDQWLLSHRVSARPGSMRTQRASPAGRRK